MKIFIYFYSDPHIQNVFKYNHLCRLNNLSLTPKCFYDTNYLCKAECFSLLSDNC